MSFAYRLPVSEIKRVVSSWDVSRLIAAYNQGLLPDPQTETARICAVLANVNRVDGKPFTVDDFLPKRQTPRVATPSELMQGFHQRRRQNNR